jgi:prolyl-tRNA editing enzyme YbaK/EbsC (Cys-tRNA(Pro) deacylase)
VKREEERVGQVTRLISEYGLDAEFIWHRERPVLSLEDAMGVHSISPGNVLKCLLLKDRSGTVVAVMAPGDVRVDVKKLEKLIGVKKLSFMPGDEMKARFGLEPGSVDPLILPAVAEVVVAEKDLLAKGFVIGSAGSKFCGLKVKPEDLVRAVRGTLVLDLSAG